MFIDGPDDRAPFNTDSMVSRCWILTTQEAPTRTAPGQRIVERTGCISGMKLNRRSMGNQLISETQFILMQTVGGEQRHVSVADCVQVISSAAASLGHRRRSARGSENWPDLPGRDIW